ncbi:hypothetical protein ACFLUC_03390 [Chloroflexota bacterium]
MNRIKFLCLLVGVGLTFVFTNGCSPPTALTPEPATPMPSATFEPTQPPSETPLPDTATADSPIDSPAPVFVTSIEDILGTWFADGMHAQYHRFEADGTCLVFTSTALKKNKPSVTCTCSFEEAQMTLHCEEAVGLPSCPGDGVYQVEILANGNIYFHRVKDACGPRVQTMRQEFYLVP